jgi:hypothetical protein
MIGQTQPRWVTDRKLTGSGRAGREEISGGGWIVILFPSFLRFLPRLWRSVTRKAQQSDALILRLA